MTPRPLAGRGGSKPPFLGAAAFSVIRRPWGVADLGARRKRGVHVGRVEAAAVQGNPTAMPGAGANRGGGEGLAVGGDQVASLAAFALETGVGEVEDEGGVVGEQGEAVDGCVGEEELLGKAEGAAGCRCRCAGALLHDGGSGEGW